MSTSFIATPEGADYARNAAAMAVGFSIANASQYLFAPKKTAKQILATELGAYAVVSIFTINLLASNFGTIAGPISESAANWARIALSFGIGSLASIVFMMLDGSRRLVFDNGQAFRFPNAVFLSMMMAVFSVAFAGLLRIIG
ncbi:hypothetical protein [Sinisalibacter aestuarii]|uniref:hypothetical protein n=1 Tax=Sinisalibacter aestuarii TaxID=2949426 RepID=UPI002490608B|nr:hypothetical protein [Sinisalibacter aestuarii]